ncbi:MAG: histidine kinase dimerization/phospho-acceptor domain-containing protein [bacterium]
MANTGDDRYRALSRILAAADNAEQAEKLLAEALQAAMSAVGVAAASLTILAGPGQPELSVRDGSEALLGVLISLEEKMLAAVRAEFGVQELYSTLDYQGEKSLFSYPIRAGKQIIGSVTGLAEGSRNLALEQEFIATIAIALRLIFGGQRQIDAARLEAVREASVTINHEINNPLTAVLGNVQLLLLKEKDLPEEIRQRLEKIEESSMRIRDAVSRLMRLGEARRTEYINGTSMIDLGKDDKDSED